MLEPDSPENDKVPLDILFVYIGINKLLFGGIETLGILQLEDPEPVSPPPVGTTSTSVPVIFKETIAEPTTSGDPPPGQLALEQPVEQ